MSEKEEREDLKSVPFDPRFPQTNQTLNCYVNYVDYHRCLNVLDSDERCEYFKNVFTTLCPFAWVEKWDRQRENGTFAGKIVRVQKAETEEEPDTKSTKSKREQKKEK